MNREQLVVESSEGGSEGQPSAEDSREKSGNAVPRDKLRKRRAKTKPSAQIHNRHANKQERDGNRNKRYQRCVLQSTYVLIQDANPVMAGPPTLQTGAKRRARALGRADAEFPEN